MADGRVPRESGAEAGGGHQGLRRSKPENGGRNGKTGGAGV